MWTNCRHRYYLHSFLVQDAAESIVRGGRIRGRGRQSGAGVEETQDLKTRRRLYRSAHEISGAHILP